MILFSFSNYEHIARELRTIPLLQVGQFAIGRYDNQELHAKVQGSVSGEHCLVLGSIAPPDDRSAVPPHFVLKLSMPCAYDW